MWCEQANKGETGGGGADGVHSLSITVKHKDVNVFVSLLCESSEKGVDV